MNSPELRGETAGVRDDSIVEMTLKVDPRHQVTIEVSEGASFSYPLATISKLQALVSQ